MYDDWPKVAMIRYRIVCKVIGPLLHLPPLYSMPMRKSQKPLLRGRVFLGLINSNIQKQFSDHHQTAYRDWHALFESCRADRFHFTIVPPLSLKKIYRAGEYFAFEIRLFGQAAQHRLLIERFLPAIEMGGKLNGIGSWIDIPQSNYGCFEVHKVLVARPDKWVEVYNPRQWFFQEVVPDDVNAAVAQTSEQRTTLTWLTPFCLKQKNTHIVEPDIASLVKFISVRLIQLQPSFCRDHFTEILAQAQKVRIFQHDLRLVELFEKRSDMFQIGKIIFEQLPPPLARMLDIGSIIHIGKATRYGNGIYEFS